MSCQKLPNFPKQFCKTAYLGMRDCSSKSGIWLLLFFEWMWKKIVKVFVSNQTTTRTNCFEDAKNIFSIKICFPIDGLFVWASSNVASWLIGKNSCKQKYNLKNVKNDFRLRIWDSAWIICVFFSKKIQLTDLCT